MAGVAATAVRVRASAAGRIRRMAYASARARKSEGASGLANGLGPDKPSRHRGIAPRPSEHCDPASCASAIEAVERHQPAALLLDVQLGDDNGFAVCEA